MDMESSSWLYAAQRISKHLPRSPSYLLKIPIRVSWRLVFNRALGKCLWEMDFPQIWATSKGSWLIRGQSATPELPCRTKTTDFLALELLCQASCPVLTLSPNLSGSYFSWGFISHILLCLFQSPWPYHSNFHQIQWTHLVLSLAFDRVNFLTPFLTHFSVSVPSGTRISSVPFHPELPFLLGELKHSFFFKTF